MLIHLDNANSVQCYISLRWMDPISLGYLSILLFYTKQNLKHFSCLSDGNSLSCRSQRNRFSNGCFPTSQLQRFKRIRSKPFLSSWFKSHKHLIDYNVVLRLMRLNVFWRKDKAFCLRKRFGMGKEARQVSHGGRVWKQHPGQHPSYTSMPIE